MDDQDSKKIENNEEIEGAEFPTKNDEKSEDKSKEDEEKLKEIEIVKGLIVEDVT